jgi:hypothetical protein
MNNRAGYRIRRSQLFTRRQIQHPSLLATRDEHERHGLPHSIHLNTTKAASLHNSRHIDIKEIRCDTPKGRNGMWSNLRRSRATLGNGRQEATIPRRGLTDDHDEDPLAKCPCETPSAHRMDGKR